MATITNIADPKRLRHKRHSRAVQSTIAELADALAGGVGIEDVLTKLIAAALAVVPEADCAKVSVIDNGRLCSVAATSQLPTSLDSAQQAARHGPCLEAISAQKAVRSGDLGTDGRWPRFAPHASIAGVRSVCPLR